MCIILQYISRFVQQDSKVPGLISAHACKEQDIHDQKSNIFKEGTCSEMGQTAQAFMEGQDEDCNGSVCQIILVLPIHIVLWTLSTTT